MCYRDWPTLLSSSATLTSDSQPHINFKNNHEHVNVHVTSFIRGRQRMFFHKQPYMEVSPAARSGHASSVALMQVDKLRVHVCVTVSNEGLRMWGELWSEREGSAEPARYKRDEREAKRLREKERGEGVYVLVGGVGGGVSISLWIFES